MGFAAAPNKHRLFRRGDRQGRDLLWMGVVLLAASVITLGIGLIRSRG